ncbi:MAG TPA: EAL domain-containing protein, partial [Methylophilaceae bacterium]|nr:EAL domain-containing protein [Methylophilaceae bacterium]
QKYGRLPGGPWPESPQRAAILPVTKPGQIQLAGFIIAGISPRLTFDDDYRGFLDLLAGHISTAVANAETYEAEHKRLTALAELQRELSISNERLKLAIEGAGDGVWDWDMQSGKITRSRRFLEILGQEEQQDITSYEAWSDLVHPNDMAKVMAAVDACIHNSPAPYICEYRMRCSNGDWKWLLSRGIVVARDTDGTPLRMTGTISDISEKRRMDETIWQHANFDSLTGLPNRRLFRDRLNQEILKSQRTGLPMALFFIDLDQFKEVNDLLGHDVGDMLLGEASKRICACVRQSDTVARLGGDEFTTIVSELEDVANVESVAQKIIAALSEPFHLGDEVIYLSASLGITMYPADADNAERLIRNADQAMYAAKNAGRNQFSYFTRSMQEEALARLRLIGDLRHALEYGQLKAYYQPVVDLSTGNIVKAEALLRWDHPHFGLLQPPAFIPLAEESGLIHEIGNWIFMEAALSSRQWTEQLGELFPISVNKSPVQLVSQNKGINWAQHLEALGMEGSSITIEITESLLLNASTNVHNKLLRYREAGLEIAIDDFGTGYSSMAYLKKFDVDYLKIDRSFIRDMTHDAGNLTIVKSVIVMAHELGLKVIAEGIENEEQRQLLAEAGCDFGQGFLYAEPLPAQQFETLLLSNYIYRRQPYQLSASVYKLIS